MNVQDSSARNKEESGEFQLNGSHCHAFFLRPKNTETIIFLTCRGKPHSLNPSPKTCDLYAYRTNLRSPQARTQSTSVSPDPILLACFTSEKPSDHNLNHTEPRRNLRAGSKTDEAKNSNQQDCQGITPSQSLIRQIPCRPVRMSHTPQTNCFSQGDHENVGRASIQIAANFFPSP